MRDPIMRSLRAEALRASSEEARAYLLGASRDGTFNRLHKTLRISQKDKRWFLILQVLFAKLGSRSWTYQEGKRDVWVIETTCRLDQSVSFSSDLECAAFARGYFDAEGGVPRDPGDRFYVQLGQKDYVDLARLKSVLTHLGLECGRLHNPSARADPTYWRFCVLSNSHQAFLRRVSSWHPRKRVILDARMEMGGQQDNLLGTRTSGTHRYRDSRAGTGPADSLDAKIR